MDMPSLVVARRPATLLDIYVVVRSVLLTSVVALVAIVTLIVIQGPTAAAVNITIRLRTS